MGIFTSVYMYVHIHVQCTCTFVRVCTVYAHHSILGTIIIIMHVTIVHPYWKCAFLLTKTTPTSSARFSIILDHKVLLNI